MRRKSVLFIDDLPSVHKYTKEISTSMNLKRRAALHPDIARKIIERRINAATKMIKLRQQLLSKTTNPSARRKLIVQIERLKDVVRSPFDLIVSDINMPHGNPSGAKFAHEVKKKYPAQRVLMHSDDLRILEELEEKLGLEFAPKIGQKGDFGTKGRLAEEMENELDVASRHLKWLRKKRKEEK